MTRNIIGSIKLEPDASAPSAAKGVMYFDSGTDKLKISEDGATFVNLGAGSATYDAVVAASGGDYTTLGAAITGGATSIFIKDGTYAETGAITLPANCTLVGESKTGTIINMQTNLLTIGEGNTLQNFHIKSSRDITLVQCSGNNILIFNCIIENTLATASVDTGACVAIDDGVGRTGNRIIGCKIIVFSGTVDNPNKRGIQGTSASARFQIDNCEIIGAGSSYQVYAFYLVAEWCNLTNLRIVDFGKTATDFVFLGFSRNSNYSDWVFENCVGKVTVDSNSNYCNFVNWEDFTGAVSISNECDFVHYTNIHLVGTFTAVATGIQPQISNSSFDGGMSIAANRTMINNSRVGATAGGGANTITITGAANDVLITNTFVDAAISDGGTGTVSDTVVY